MVIDDKKIFSRDCSLENIVEAELSSEDENDNSDELLLEYNSYLEEFDGLPNAKCLFCDFASQITQDIWEHMRTKHNFNFKKITSDKDEYGQIKLINYLRNCEKKGLNVEHEFKDIKNESSFWNDDSFLIPIIKDDRLILELDTIYEEDLINDNDDPNILNEFSLEEENRILKQKIASLTSIILELRKRQDEDETRKDPCPSPSSRISTASENSNNQISPQELSIKLLDLSERESSVSTNSDSEKIIKFGKKNQFNLEDKSYFNSYSSLEIHREMIMDKVRTNSYYDFITNATNSELLFKDKIVLDVGTGTGILSLFALQSGAKMVIAVDAAEYTIKIAEKIARINKLDGKLIFICGKFEDLDLYFVDNNVISKYKNELPPENSMPFKCDVIISEWMGYCLLYESMLYTILDARDRYLKVEDGDFIGKIFPSSVRLQISLADYSDQIDDQINPWIKEKLYNLDLSEMSPKLSSLLSTPHVDIVPNERLRCNNVLDLPALSILNLSKEELTNLRQPIKIEIPKNISFYTSLIVSFSAVFDCEDLKVNRVVLETSPFKQPTHWKQTILHLKSPEDSLIKANCDLNGFITIIPRVDNSRHISIFLELFDIKTIDNKTYPRIYNHYIMN